MEEEYQEITLADIVRTLYRRKVILISVFLLCLIGGIAVTVFTTPQYESTASLVPLEHPDIIKNWLDSRKAAGLVIDGMGTPLLREMFPGMWNDAAFNWTNGPPDPETAATALAARTTVSFTQDLRFETGDRFITVTVQLTDPLLARDAADAYLLSLEQLRPELERATENRWFAQFYAETGNEQEARREAERIAQNTDYWLILDNANTPKGPSSPNTMLNVALSIVLGLMLGVFSVFAWEWFRNFRTEAKAPDVAPEAAVSEPKEAPRRYS